MTPRLLRQSFLIGLISTLAASAQTGPGAPSSAPESVAPVSVTTAPSVPAADDEMIDGIKLTDATIDHVLMLIEDWTGRTVLRPQQLPTPTFAINLKRRIPKSEAILALETLLNLNGIGIAPVGDKFLKVVDLPRMRMEAPEMIEGSTLDLPPSGQIASKLFQLEFQRVTEFLPQINMLLNGNLGGYVVFEKSNAALITDSISTLQRIELLLKKLDQPLTAGLNPHFYAVHNVKASDLVSKINAIVQGPLQSQLGSATRYTADDRTNQIVLLSDPRQYPFFDDLILKLDVKSDPNTRNEVIYLKHAAAKDVATLLSNLIAGQSKASQSSNSVRPGQILPLPGSPAAGQPAQSNVTVEMGAHATGDLGSNTNEFSGLVDIQPDERSNAVVVSGTVDDIRLIKDLVEKVDILLKQVRIEVVIAEVTISDNQSSGINSLGIGVDGSRVTSLSVGAAGLSGSAGGPVVGNLTHANGATTLSLSALLNPLRSKGNVEFLSAPTIVTTHNKEASIISTQQQPVITSIQRAATSGLATTPTTPVDNAFNSSSSVTYKDIGIQLKVTPLIGTDNNIQLKVDQIVDDVIDTVNIDGNSQPVIGHRQATSFVNVSSDEMIVLGGLQRNRRQITHGRFGIVWEIPVIGWLLGPRSKNVTRTELLVFIRPHVIKPEDNVADTNRLIDQQAEKEVIKNFINPETRSDDPDKAKKKTTKTSIVGPAPGTN